jgi:hypothetical protein
MNQGVDTQHEPQNLSKQRGSDKRPFDSMGTDAMAKAVVAARFAIEGSSAGRTLAIPPGSVFLNTA